MNFCGKCGALLKTDATTTILQESPNQEEQSSTYQQAGDVSARGTASDRQDERRFVTVMFTDLSGFTAMSEKMDPEEVRNLLNAFFEQLAPVVRKYGGTIEKFIGDEIMAFFGAPVAHENDPERALRAALEMMDALEDFNANRSIDLGIHFGINTGLVVAGVLGTAEQQSYAVTGDTVNLAARLRDVSERGQILVGPDTYRLTHRLFDFQEIGPIRVRGKAEAVPVYKVLGVRARPESMHGLETPGISSPLVGREVEAAAFSRCLDRLLAGQGGIVSIIGEAGLGKSRLVAEMRSKMEDQELSWLEGRAISFSQNISYWPFLEILKRDVGITEQDDETESWDKLKSRVAALFPEQVSEILPYLATLLALEVRGELEERVKYLDGEAMKRQIFRASLWFFQRLSQERPLVLIFEDWHWIDQSSAALLEHLLPLVESCPLLIGVVSRPTLQATRFCEIAKDYSDHYTEIVLSPLSEDDSVQLVRNLLKIDELPSQSSGLILQKAEGNPFFVEQVIRSLIDMGVIVRDEAMGGWRITTPVEAIAIPNTIRGVIMARIDRLDEEVKEALKVASVIGRSFFYRVLRTIAEAEDKLDEHLVELQRVELIREKNRVPELEYIFKHALAQEAAYESTLLRRRQELHRQVGDCIETLFAERLEEFYGLLAYHYARAEDWAKAQDYLFKAGDQAGKVAADAEALTHYQQAMAAYTRAFGDRWDVFQRAVLERKMGEALFQRGAHQQATEYLQRALTYLGKPLPTSRWGIRLSIFRQLVKQVGHRWLPRLLLRHTAGRVDSAIVEERFRVYDTISWIDYFGNPERLFLDVLTSLNLSEQNDYSLGIVHGAIGVGMVCMHIPVFWLTGRYHCRAVSLAEEMEHPLALANAYQGLGFYESYLGEWDAAIKHLRRAVAANVETGDLHGQGMINTLIAFVLCLKGDFTPALESIQEAVRIGRDGADHQVWGLGLIVQGHILLRTGPLGEAETHLQKGLELAKAVPDYRSMALAFGDLGQCYLRQGKLQQALAVLEESAQFIAERGVRGDMATPARFGLPEAYLAATEQIEGIERTKMLKKAKRACQAALKECKMFCGGLPPAYRLRGTYEWLRSKPSTARKWWRRSLTMAEELGARYDLGMTHLEMGKRMEEYSHLEDAEAIFTEIGAKLDLAQARELLKTGE